MKPLKSRVGTALLGLALLPVAIGCALFERKGPESNVPKVALPQKPPARQVLEFDDPPGDVPPRPKARTPAPLPTVSSAALSIDPDTESRIRKAAERDPRVQEALGGRYAYISTSLIEPDKRVSRTAAAPAPRLSRVTFYSYTKNVAVEVRMRDEDVVSVVARKDYQPPETDEEIQVAVELAKKDTRLQDKVQDLTGHALVMAPEPGWIWNEPGYGHRVLWVTFAKEGELEPRYWAVVDLSDRNVLKVGTEPQR
jgi:hypothetical protein